LEDDVLATWPRDPVRGVVLRRRLRLSATPALSLEVAADGARAWDLEIYADNLLLLKRRIDGGSEKSKERHWDDIRVDLAKLAGKEVQLRLYQRVLLPDRIPGNAYWKNLRLE
jgi:hypothetical protein